MKVNNSTTSATRDTGKAAAAEGSETRKSPKGKASERAENNEKVEISPKAKEAAKAKQLAKSAPDTNDEKIAKIKAQIGRGEYKVDAEKIADRLVDEHMSASF